MFKTFIICEIHGFRKATKIPPRVQRVKVTNKSRGEDGKYFRTTWSAELKIEKVAVNNTRDVT